MQYTDIQRSQTILIQTSQKKKKKDENNKNTKRGFTREQGRKMGETSRKK
jgi:beta-lactam-binding protein with PASTA domain